MGCCGDREKFDYAKNEQKWDYINLDDFKSQSCGTPFSYGFLWFLGIVSVAVYAVDLFTAANLLFFDRWSGQVEPAIPFYISRWIFAGCIMLTWVLLAFRMIRAIRAIKSGVITKCYLDPLAVRIQSANVGGQGRGWKRFLVFAALTKGRKGAEYVALFTYFTFEAWLRICFAEGPRQVINALTLYSVLKAQLIPAGAHKPDNGHSPVAQFFVNIQILANQDKQQAAVLFGMLYTLIIWIFSALSLIAAVLFYLLFLWHHIPSADGTLSRYCRRKIEKRLNKIVKATVDKALAKADKKRAAHDLARPGIAGTATSDIKRQPTLPIFEEKSAGADFPSDALPSNPPPFLTRAESHGGNSDESISALNQAPTVPNVLGHHSRPGLPSRQTTQSSVNSQTSYASDAPLIDQAADPGYGGQYWTQSESRSQSRNALHRIDSDFSTQNQRPATARSFSSQSRDPHYPQHPPMGPPRRQNTDMTSSTTYTARSQSRPPPSYRGHSFNGPPRRPPQPPLDPNRRPTQEFEMQPPSPNNVLSGRSQPTVRPVPETAPAPGFIPYRPYNPGPPSAPVRNFTMPLNPTTPRDYYGQSSDRPERSGTAPVPRSGGYRDFTIDAYSQPQPIPSRPATTGPRPNQLLNSRSWNGGGDNREW